MAPSQIHRGHLRGLFYAAGLALLAAGCVPAGAPTAQLTAPAAPKMTTASTAAPAAPAKTASVPKTAAPAKTAALPPKTKKTSSPPSAGGSASAPAADLPSTPAPDPVAAPAAGSGVAEALPGTPGGAGAPTATASVGPVKYPNVNIAPPEPTGTLLPPSEREKMIGELQALKNRQGDPPSGGGGNAADLQKQGATHGADAIKAIEKCGDDATAASDPDCQAPSSTPAD